MTKHILHKHSDQRLTRWSNNSDIAGIDKKHVIQIHVRAKTPKCVIHKSIYCALHNKLSMNKETHILALLFSNM